MSRRRDMERIQADEEQERIIFEMPFIAPQPYTGKPIKTFIISFNRLSFLKQQLEYLMKNPALDLHIVDNGSTYPPLLDYLDELDLDVTFFPANEGHTVVWKNKMPEIFCKNEPYIVTDNDIIPDHPNFHELLIEGLNKHSDVNKIGLGLHIDDLPDNIPFKDEIIQHEKGIQKIYLLDDSHFVRMPVDTTLAIYRDGYHHYSVWGTDKITHDGQCRALRTIHPLWQAKHLSWYLTPEDLKSEENKYYFNSIKQPSTHWSEKQKYI